MASSLRLGYSSTCRELGSNRLSMQGTRLEGSVCGAMKSLRCVLGDLQTVALSLWRLPQVTQTQLWHDRCD